MSIPLVKEEIGRFLQTTTPEILCIRGDWGTGKTYVWDACATLASKNKQIGLTHYAYCSLFGLNSVNDLKQSIVENTVPAKTLANPKGSTVEERLSWFYERGKQGAKMGAGKLASATAEFFRVKSAADLVAPSLFWFVRDQVVVFDDVERKGQTLTIAEVMGLLSFLKEQRNCKAVLIMNEGQLGKETGAFNRYVEKVIDISLVFAPSSEECAEISLNSDDPTEVALREYCTFIGLTNIRVIERIKKFARRVVPLLGGKDEHVVEQALKTLALLCWVHFVPDDAPSLTFIADRTQRRMATIVRKSSPAETPSEKEWHRKLDALGSNTLTEFDRSLLQGIEYGFFDESLVARLASEFASAARDNDAQAAFNNAWRLFHDSFEQNEATLVDAFATSIRGAVNFISPSNLDGSIELLRALGQDAIADALIEYYMATRKGDASFFSLRDNHPFERVRDPALAEAFKRKAASFVDALSLDEALIATVTRATAAQARLRIAASSPEDLRDALKRLRGDHLYDAMEGLLLNTETAKNGNTVAQNAHRAFELIAQEDKLNAQRVTNKLGRFSR
jgi:hypothetical protein